VVVIYDDHDIGFILARTLEKMGYQVESVSYQRGTLSRLRERGFRLAVVEVRMADANGLRRVEVIREADPGLPVILVSGPGDSIGLTMQLGVEAWIDKPFRLEEVRAAVKKVLG
jgi:DNA-binding NtrC family response regulator